jgi:hypothetical protein
MRILDDKMIKQWLLENSKNKATMAVHLLLTNLPSGLTQQLAKIILLTILELILP